MFKVGDYIVVKFFGGYNRLVVTADFVDLWNELHNDNTGLVEPDQCNEPGNTCARIKGYDDAQLWYWRNANGL